MRTNRFEIAIICHVISFTLSISSNFCVQNIDVRGVIIVISAIFLALGVTFMVLGYIYKNVEAEEEKM